MEMADGTIVSNGPGNSITFTEVSRTLINTSVILSICTVYRKLYNNVILYTKVIPLNRVECTSTTTNQIEVKMIALSYRERAEKLEQR